jgi:branched-subunit amino acid transport protein
VTFDAFGAWWWPYLFILIAGWLATDMWRFLGVYIGGRLSEESGLLVLVRCVATALVAAVIGNLIIFPGGSVAAMPIALRLAAVVAGFAAYLGSGKRVLVGIVAGEAVLLGGLSLVP